MLNNVPHRILLDRSALFFDWGDWYVLPRKNRILTSEFDMFVMKVVMHAMCVACQLTDVKCECHVEHVMSNMSCQTCPVQHLLPCFIWSLNSEKHDTSNFDHVNVKWKSSADTLQRLFLTWEGGVKASLQTNAQAAFFFLRFMLCVLHLRAVDHRDQFFAAGRFTNSNQSCCCGLEDYPRNIAWRIFETLVFQGGWR